jgi:hypothetical protein
MIERIGPSRLAYILAMLVGVVTADAASGGANAQCPPGAQIFIDPRLVPGRPQISPEGFQAVLANPWISEQQKQQYLNLYLNQYQPIQMPYRNGIVLISPTNHCIQQYPGN